MGVRANGDVVTDFGAPHHRQHHGHVVAHLGVFQHRSRPNATAIAQAAGATQVGLRFDHHIAAKAAVFAQSAARGIHEGHPFVHPMIP